MRRFMPMLLLLAGCELSCGPSGQQAFNDPGPEPERRAALAMAGQFLGLLDGGSIAAAYSLVTDAAREQTNRTDWASSVAGKRSEAGRFLSRELIVCGYTKQLSGLPPGSYFVIEYNSLFGARVWRERLTVALEPDGWRITAYSLLKMS